MLPWHTEPGAATLMSDSDRIRLAELVAALSLGVDLGFGQPMEHVLRQTRIALRLPALCGAPTREEAEQVLGISVARQQEITGPFTSLTKQRREVLGHREALESLGRSPGGPYVELLPRPKNRSNHAAIVNLSTGCGNQYGPHLVPQATPGMIEHVGPPDMREAALT